MTGPDVESYESRMPTRFHKKKKKKKKKSAEKRLQRNECFETSTAWTWTMPQHQHNLSSHHSFCSIILFQGNRTKRKVNFFLFLFFLLKKRREFEQIFRKGRLPTGSKNCSKIRTRNASIWDCPLTENINGGHSCANVTVFPWAFYVDTNKFSQHRPARCHAQKCCDDNVNEFRDVTSIIHTRSQSYLETMWRISWLVNFSSFFTSCACSVLYWIHCKQKQSAW